MEIEMFRRRIKDGLSVMRGLARLLVLKEVRKTGPLKVLSEI